MNSFSKFSYPLFNELPFSLKVLYFNVMIVLGIGYIFAMIQIYEVHAERDGKPGLSVRDIQIAYSGSKADTRLEAALKGPMSGMLVAEEKSVLINWVRDGAAENDYSIHVAPIIKIRCLACHDGSSPHIPNLSDYAKLKEFIHIDNGMSIGTLVRVSHIHLFGLTFIFAFMGLIFSHSYVRNQAIKALIISIPFIAIFLDIGSWWLTWIAEGGQPAAMMADGEMGLAQGWNIPGAGLILTRRGWAVTPGIPSPPRRACPLTVSLTLTTHSPLTARCQIKGRGAGSAVGRPGRIRRGRSLRDLRDRDGRRDRRRPPGRPCALPSR